ILVMLAVIVASDQLIWRPLLAWADKFKMELIESGEAPRSWLYDFLRRNYIFPWIEEHWVQGVSDGFIRLKRKVRVLEAVPAHTRNLIWRAIFILVGTLAAIWLGYEVILGIIAAVDSVYNHVTAAQIGELFVLGLLTMGRVALMTVLATIIWTPVGV